MAAKFVLDFVHLPPHRFQQLVLNVGENLTALPSTFDNIKIG